jgi:hypothetical protein
MNTELTQEHKDELKPIIKQLDEIMEQYPSRKLADVINALQELSE